jgi:hypothetical protein
MHNLDFEIVLKNAVTNMHDAAWAAGDKGIRAG